MELRTRKIKKFESFFREKIIKAYNIELVYLFGSHAAGTEGPISDVDLALLYAEIPPASETYRLKHEVTVFLNTAKVDIVVLNVAPIELKYAVIATGILIYEVSLPVRVEFEANTLSLYGDYLPVLRRQRQELLEQDNEEAGVQRYRKALGKTQRLLEEIESVSK
jgi:predicted nucleotidyltransferase